MRRILREPLVHFLVLGLVLFAWFEWRGGSGPGSRRISITSGLVQHLAAGFSRTWQRPPTESELKGLIDDYVKEEIATREAVAMGLDREDAIIRRRLRQKLEFLVEDEVEQAPPTNDELRAWLDEHPDAFAGEPRVSLRQVYVRTDRRGDGARSRAESLLSRLRAAGPDADIDDLGDPSLLPAELPLGPVSEVARVFGTELADGIDSLPVEQWSGPFESGYGLHLVLIRERVPASRPALEDIRPYVERDVLAARKDARLQALYERLLERYTVDIEMPRKSSADPVTAGSAR